MSVHRRITDLAQRGAEGRFMTLDAEPGPAFGVHALDPGSAQLHAPIRRRVFLHLPLHVQQRVVAQNRVELVEAVYCSAA